jgi:hypothetical protein
MLRETLFVRIMRGTPFYPDASTIIIWLPNILVKEWAIAGTLLSAIIGGTRLRGDRQADGPG